jgi:hypothetical protein
VLQACREGERTGFAGQRELPDNNPVIQRSIAQRNELTDVLNLCQIELLRRFRESAGGEQGKARRNSLAHQWPQRHRRGDAEYGVRSCR